jgi:hypothetical protein
MLDVPYGESVKLLWIVFGLGIMGEGIRSGSKAMGGGILALITISIGAAECSTRMRRNRVPVLCILTCFSSCGSLSWWRAGLWRLPPLEGFDDAHLATAVGAWLAKGERGCLCGWRVIELGLFGPEHVCRTLVIPTRAPSRLGSAAMVVTVIQAGPRQQHR